MSINKNISSGREQEMLDKGKDRYLKKLERQKYLSKDNIHSTILDKAMPNVIKGIEDYISLKELSRGSLPKGFNDFVGIPVPTLAHIGLRAICDCCGTHSARTPQTAMTKIGRQVQAELFAIDLEENKKKYYLDKNEELKSTDIKNNILREVSELGFKNNGQKLAKVYKLAEKEGILRREWDADKCAEVGMHIYDVTMTSSGLFKETVYRTKNNTKKTIEFLAQVVLEIQESTSLKAFMKPMLSCLTYRPEPYTDLDKGGYHDPRLSSISRLLKSYTYDQGQQIRHDFAKAKFFGDLPEYAKAVNALQDVPLKINTEVLRALEWCWSEKKEFPKGSKFPSQQLLLELPTLDQEVWRSMDDKARKHHHVQNRKIREKNLATQTAHQIMAVDLDSANDLEGNPFWIPWNLDNRGRMYPVSNFNYHRDDHVKSLFLLSNGCNLDLFNDHWLKIHIANLGGFQKVDKKPLMDRVAWTDSNSDWLADIGRDPKGMFKEWSRADKPFQFLAACIEWAEYMEAKQLGLPFVSFVSPALDGTNSGCQHFSAAGRNTETGTLVNLVPTDEPQDVYQKVCDSVIKKLNDIIALPLSGDEKEQFQQRKDKELAQAWLDYGLTRKHVKKNAMTYAYSSPVFGFKEQIKSDIMDFETDAIYKTEGRSTDEHPFGNPEEQDVASFFLARISFESVQSVLISAKEGMEFFRKLSDALSLENKPVSWTTPIGFPVYQKYTKRMSKVITPFLSDMSSHIKTKQEERVNSKGETVWETVHETVVVGKPKRTQITVRLWRGKDIDKRRTKQGISPNIIHSYDASHMMSTILSLKEQGVNDFMMIHDSFAVQNEFSWDLFHTVRDTFVKQYENHCMYSNLKSSCLNKLNPDGPSFENISKLNIPNIGDLDINSVRKSDYCFS